MVRDTEPFLFLGGSPALDFVNTEIVVHGEPKDLLGGESDLLHWMSASGLACAGMRTRGLADAKVLRSELRRMFLRLAAGEPLRPADVEGINDALAGAGGHLEVRFRDHRPHIEIGLLGRPSPAFLIARATAEFLAGADLSLIRQCEGSGCILLFYDTTKSHTRRWCSMAACGNRSKAAEHYRRVSKSRKAG
ncbi:MAG TPA: ABATE domain-containing protein [Thermoanaerobaculia bacterium]|nr:ABATE domain-containing protein [Thermoanaerobaculia bacterium]